MFSGVSGIAGVHRCTYGKKRVYTLRRTVNVLEELLALALRTLTVAPFDDLRKKERKKEKKKERKKERGSMLLIRGKT